MGRTENEGQNRGLRSVLAGNYTCLVSSCARKVLLYQFASGLRYVRLFVAQVGKLAKLASVRAELP